MAVYKKKKIGKKIYQVEGCKLNIKVVSYTQAARQGSAKSSSYWSGKEENGS